MPIIFSAPSLEEREESTEQRFGKRSHEAQGRDGDPTATALPGEWEADQASGPIEG